MPTHPAGIAVRWGPFEAPRRSTQEAFHLNSRQRVKCAINFSHPDRVPISHAVLPAAQIKYGKALDEILTEFREDFGWDYMPDLPLADFPAVYKQGRNIDDFGTVWFSEWRGVCGIPIEWPISDLGALRRISNGRTILPPGRHPAGFTAAT